MLEHRIKGSIRRGNSLKLLNAHDRVNTHVTYDLNGIGTPRSDELTACTDEGSRERSLGKGLSATKEPRQAIEE